MMVSDGLEEANNPAKARPLDSEPSIHAGFWDLML
jgi:hypothetical protein